MDKKVRVLYIDDNEFDRELVRHSLESEENNFELIEASNQDEFKTLLDKGGYDLVLSDFNILGYKGLQVIEEVQQKYPGLPVILVTGTGSEEIAVDVLKKGALDYVIKTPHHIKRLPQTIKTAFEKKELEEKNREAENALRKSEEQYRGVFEAATDSFLVYNLNGEIVEANPAACKIYGYQYEELIGLTGKDIVHSDYYNEFKNFKEAVLSGTPFFAESVDIRKDGTAFDVEVRGAAFTFLGRPHLLAIIHDVTLRKKAEKELKLNKEKLEVMVQERTGELEEKNKELERLNDIFIGREFRIKELNDKVKELEGKVKNLLK